MTREPVVVIGVVASIVVAIAVQLLAAGLVTSDQAVNFLHFIIVATPLVAAALARLFVTPVAAPVLPINTEVTTPAGGNAVVTKASPNR